MKAIENIMRMAPVIPVLVVNRVEDAVPIARALVAGGLPVLEVTLRTDCALDAIKEMKTVAGAVVGAGTVLDPDQLKASVDAGSEFIVSPGITENLGNAALDHDVPFLPGVANASDIMRGLDLGLKHFKFFPAQANGGVSALGALCGPFGNIKFCPTGGITADSAMQWLAMDQVLCVGGSWLTSGDPDDIQGIGQRAQKAAKLRQAR